jgi:hypothetical protein
MNLPAKEVAEYLEDNSVGTVGTDIYVDQLPEQTGVVTMIASLSGVPDIDLPTAKPGFEVLVRGSSEADVVTKIYEIVELLHRKFNTTLITGGNYYYFIKMTTEPQSLGRDEKGRIEFSANFETYIRER